MKEIESRRSIRKYRHEKMDEKDLQKILEAGRLSPSAKNKQPWEFVVIENEEIKKEIATKLAEKLARENPTSEAIESCSALIVVFNTMESDVWNIMSIGACIENMILEATQLGYGSLWVGLIREIAEKVNHLCQNQNELIAAVCIGKKDEEPDKRPRKKLDEFVTYIR